MELPKQSKLRCTHCTEVFANENRLHCHYTLNKIFDNYSVAHAFGLDNSHIYRIKHTKLYGILDQEYYFCKYCACQIKSMKYLRRHCFTMRANISLKN